IQYDSSGNAVSWLDLDANAHFANAFLSGRVEASEGFFGDNLRLRDSKREIIRPDGVISTSDVMVRGSATMKHIDPTFNTKSKESGGGLSQDAIQKWSGYDESRVDFLDGRYTGFEDVRDSDYRNSLRIQRYYFIHSARYFVLTYRTVQGAGTNLPGGLHRHL